LSSRFRPVGLMAAQNSRCFRSCCIPAGSS
jgi:hypothetical protein